MKYIDADLLRKEIEKLKKEYDARVSSTLISESLVCMGKVEAINKALCIIDSLRQEHSEVDLEEEADRMFFSLGWYEGDHHQPMLDCVSLEQFRDIARHFAEWGEKNAYKAIMKKADEVRDKRFDTDYEVKIEPAAGFDLGCVNVYHEGKLVGQYVELKEEKKLPEGLDEAAETQYPVIWRKYPRDGIVRSETEYDVNAMKRNAFKAGAEWDRAKMLEGAVAVEVVGEKRDLRLIDSTQRCLFNAERGDWLKIIIVKED